MIDTSIKRISLTFRNNMEGDFPEPTLPEGFTFEPYKGDEEGKRIWAEVLITVGFHGGNVEGGINCFNNEFSGDIELAKQRVFFLKAPDGKYIGTCAAWEDKALGRGRLHWLGVNPEYQKYGLGRALVEKVLHTFKEQLPGTPVYLVTQTSSHKAICLYMKLGFFPLFWNEQSKADYEESVSVLNGVMRSPDYEKFASYVYDDTPQK